MFVYYWSYVAYSWARTRIIVIGLVAGAIMKNAMERARVLYIVLLQLLLHSVFTSMLLERQVPREKG